MTELEWTMVAVRARKPGESLWDAHGRVFLERAMDECDRNVERVAALLGVSTQRVYRLATQYGIVTACPQKRHRVSRERTLRLARVGALLALLAFMPVRAQLGICNPDESLEWDAVPGASYYVLYASVDGQPWKALDAIPAVSVRVVDGEVQITQNTAFLPAKVLDAETGAAVLLTVGHNAWVGQGGDDPIGCLWERPCAMGFSGDARADMLACANATDN